MGCTSSKAEQTAQGDTAAAARKKKKRRRVTQLGPEDESLIKTSITFLDRSSASGNNVPVDRPSAYLCPTVIHVKEAVSDPTAPIGDISLTGKAPDVPDKEPTSEGDSKDTSTSKIKGDKGKRLLKRTPINAEQNNGKGLVKQTTASGEGDKCKRLPKQTPAKGEDDQGKGLVKQMSTNGEGVKCKGLTKQTPANKEGDQGEDQIKPASANVEEDEGKDQIQRTSANGDRSEGQLRPAESKGGENEGHVPCEVSPSTEAQEGHRQETTGGNVKTVTRCKVRQ